MARSTRTNEPQPADLTPDQMKAALPKLERRIRELEEFDVDTVESRSDPRIDSFEDKIDSTLVGIFGSNSTEYHRFCVGSLDRASINMMYQTPLNEVRAGFQQGINQAISTLKTIIDLFNEEIEDLGVSPSGRALKALGELELHPEIDRAVSKLFKDGHYANAVEDACKVLDGLVKIRSGKHDLSGTELMQFVFSPKSPILKFNELDSQSNQSEQQGMMFLYAGAMLAIRNPRAHLIIKDDPERALEYIGLLSLLAKSLDDTDRA